MTVLQQYQLWIGLGFVLLVVIFLFVIFFFKEKLTEDQRQIVRFLTSLCAGFAGALITGDALFKMETHLGRNTTLAVSGAAGFALFFTVWFTSRQLVLPDAVNFRIPDGWIFRQVADALAQQDNAVTEYVGFTDDELAAPLQARELHVKTMVDAFRAIRHLAKGSAVRAYDVTFEAPVYRLHIRS